MGPYVTDPEYVALTHHQRSFLLQQVESTIETHNESNCKINSVGCLAPTLHLQHNPPSMAGKETEKILRARGSEYFLRDCVLYIERGSCASKISTIW